jgi:hypothetical protein
MKQNGGPESAAGLIDKYRYSAKQKTAPAEVFSDLPAMVSENASVFCFELYRKTPTFAFRLKRR